MVHVEGPIVESVYEAFLLSWHNKFHPPLLTLSKSPANATNTEGGGEPDYKFGKDNEHLKHIDVAKAGDESRDRLRHQHDALHAGDSADEHSKVDTKPVTTTAEEAPHGQAGAEDTHSKPDQKPQGGFTAVTQEGGQKDDDKTARHGEEVSAGDTTNQAEADATVREMDLKQNRMEGLAKHLSTIHLTASFG